MTFWKCSVLRSYLQIHSNPVSLLVGMLEGVNGCFNACLLCQCPVFSFVFLYSAPRPSPVVSQLEIVR